MAKEKKHLLKSIQERLYRQIRKVSFYKRLLFLFLLLLVLIFLSMSAIIIQSIKDYRETIAFETSQQISSYENTVNSAIATLDAVTKFQIIQNAHSYSTIYCQLEEDPGEWTSDYVINSKIMDEIKPLYDIDRNIYLISILDRSACHLYCYKDALVYHTFPDNSDASYLKLARDASGGLVVLNSKDIDSTLPTLPEDSLCGVRSIVSLFPRKEIGTSVCCVDVSPAVDQFSLSRRFADEEICFFDKNNVPLLGTLPSSCAESLRQLSPIRKDKLSSCLLKENDKYYLYYYSLSSGNSLCVVRIPYREVVSDIVQKNIFILILLFVSVVTMIIISKILVDSIRMPIQALAEACKDVRDGHFGTLIEDNSSDEMHDLIHSFNEMSEKISFLIDEVYRKEAMQSKTELQLLRSQINPHFMYNTLETIRSSAMIKHDDDIIEMVSLFGQLLRYGISNTYTLVSTCQVHEYLDAYVRLQQLHYKQNCIVNITFDPALDECYMLKLLLQPLLENCIYHSMGDSNQTCMIDVIGYPEFDCMVFKVSDNGRGVDEKTVVKINQYINDENSEFNSIGLRNVNRRIKLYYGEEYGILFESLENYGSTVTVTIPILTENDLQKIQEKEETNHDSYPHC